MTTAGLGERVAGYRLDALGGRGGMGLVYRATDLERDRVVALKVIAPALASDPVFRERFQREAGLLAAVDHPHVIPFFETDEVDGRLLLAMRWVEGPSLADEIERGGGLDVDRVRRVLGQVAGALDAVHAQGLVHRDLKPSNVLLESSDEGEHSYLTDFGAGRALDVPSEVTNTGQWLGTIDYVAPEILSGRRADARSDLYALGCVLFEALTGAPPFHRETQLGTLWAHQREPVPSAHERRPMLPRRIDAILARALAKDPDDRYRSADQLAQAFEDALRFKRGAHTGPSRIERRLPIRANRPRLSELAKPIGRAVRRVDPGRGVHGAVSLLANTKARIAPLRSARARLIVAPIVLGVLTVAIIVGEVLATPGGRTGHHRGTSLLGSAAASSLIAQHPVDSRSKTAGATSAKTERKIAHRASTRRPVARSASTRDAGGTSATVTPVRYTTPSRNSSSTSQSTATSTPRSSPTTSSSSGGSSSGPSSSAPFGPGYPGG